MSSTTSSDSEFGFQTDAGDTLTDLPSAGGVKNRIVKRESELSRFDVDGDGKFTASELRSIDQALLHSQETISLLKRVAAGLAILLLLIAIALGSTTSVMIYDAIREPTTDVAPSTTDGGAVSLVSPAGSQVQVVQSAAEIMLGMLPTFVQMSPLQAIKALPESIVLWDPYAQSWVALRPIKFAVRQWTQAVTIACASDERIVIHDEMHGMVFKNAAAVSEWDDLVAAGNAPDPSDDDGANASRFHFCAACAPIELKSLLTNGMLDGVFARFDDNTKNRSCDGFAATTSDTEFNVTNGYASEEAATSNVVAVCAECAAQRMTYTPQVCMPGPEPATRGRREEEPEEDWATRREHVKQIFGQRRRRSTKCLFLDFDTNPGGNGAQFLDGNMSLSGAAKAEVAALVASLGGDPGGELCCDQDTVVLGHAGRAALVAEVDNHRARQAETGRSVSDDVKLELTKSALEGLIGEEACGRLVGLFSGPIDRILVRRTAVGVAGGGPIYIKFHTDTHLRTMQVMLNDETAYSGGRVVFATDQGFRQPRRAAGTATIHGGRVVHGVTGLEAGVRYGLFFFQNLPFAG